MLLKYAKWIAACVLLCVTLFFTILPLFIMSKRKKGSNHELAYARILSLFSCAGGGVFLGTCLLHLFPDVQMQMNTAFNLLKIKTTFPVSEFLLAFGFLIVLIIEQIVLTAHQNNEEEIPFLHQHENDDDETEDHETGLIHSSYGAIGEEQEEDETNKSVHEDQSSHSHLRSAVLVLALSLHSVFEGLAIGLQSSSDKVLRILVAVLIHKSIIAFTLGLNLTNSKFTKGAILRSIAIFSFMSPFGTLIGSLICDVGTGVNMALTSGVLQGIAAGTFIYVTFFEVLPHELNSKHDKMWKVLCLVLGFSAITLLTLYVPD